MHDVGDANNQQRQHGGGGHQDQPQEQQVSNASQQNHIHQNPMQQQLLMGEGATSQLFHYNIDNFCPSVVIGSCVLLLITDSSTLYCGLYTSLLIILLPYSLHQCIRHNKVMIGGEVSTLTIAQVNDVLQMLEQIRQELKQKLQESKHKLASTSISGSLVLVLF